MSFVLVRDVLKKYGRKIAVDHLSFAVNRGDIFGMVGPNGAGKSTMIKMMCGLIKADGGEILIDNHSIEKQPNHVKSMIGVVPQDIAIFGNLTAKENVSFFGQLYGLSGAKLEMRVEEALSFVGLLERKNEKPKTFSGGMKRRLNIACAIVHRPQLIIMDEPTVGIDPHSRNHILDCVRELNREGATIFYTSHYMEEVSAICNQIGIMDYGRLIAVGTQEELRQKISGLEKISMKVNQVSTEALEELRKHPKIKEILCEDDTLSILLPMAQSYVQDIIYVLSKHGGVIKSLTIEEQDLEQMFLSLTGKRLRD